MEKVTPGYLEIAAGDTGSDCHLDSSRPGISSLLLGRDTRMIGICLLFGLRGATFGVKFILIPQRFDSQSPWLKLLRILVSSGTPKVSYK